MWWGGFLLCGLLLILVAIPFYAFPKTLQVRITISFLSKVFIQYFIYVEAVKLSGNLHQFQTLSFQILSLFDLASQISNQKRNQQDAINSDLFNQLYLNMFQASLRPSSGELTALELLHMVSSTGYCWL
jgi:hypothetical protein